MYTEMKSLPKFMESKPGDPVELERNALDAIRNILKEDADESRQSRQERKAARIAAAEAEDAAALTEAAKPAKPSGFARLQSAVPLAAPVRQKPQERRRSRRLAAPTPSFRPTRKHWLMLGAAVLVLLRPWLVFWIVMLCIFVPLGVFLMMGSERFWQSALSLGQWYAKRYPDRAPEMRRRLDGIAVKWDQFLDHFPDGSVDGLYMPDFNEMAVAEDRYDRALDRRLANLREGEV